MNTDNALNSQRVFKKSSPNNKLTLYLSSRDLIVENGTIDKIQGVLHVEPEHMENKKLFGQVTLTFRYGREDEEVMGLKFCNEAIMSLAQIWPPHCAHEREPNTLLQDALIKRLGSNAYPFHLELTPLAPPSVQLVPAKQYHGAPIGTSYDVRAYIALQDALRKRLGSNAYPFHLELTPLAPPSVQLVPAKQYHGAPIGTSYDVRAYIALQDALIKRLGSNAYPFHLELTPLAPPSVQLVPAKQYHGAPIGTSYDVRAYIAERADEKVSRRNTVRMGIRVLQGPGRPAPPPPDTTLSPAAPASPAPASSPRPPPSPHVLSALAHHNVLRLKTKTKPDSETNTSRNKRDEIENMEPAPPRAAVEKPFLLSDGRVELEAWLDKATYSHGESLHVGLVVANHSSKTVRRIKALVVQHVDVCMFSNGKFKNVVALVRGTGAPVPPDRTLTDTLVLTPHRGVTKNWIALEDSYSKTGASLASTVLCNSNTPEDRNVFAIYVSYYVKVKLTLSAMGGEMSLKLPFTLTHSCINEAPTDSVIEEATHKMILEGKESDDDHELDGDKQNNNDEEKIPHEEVAFGDDAEPSPDDHRCVADVLVNIENKINDRPKTFAGPTEVRAVKPNDEELDLIVKYPGSDT